MIVYAPELGFKWMPSVCDAPGVKPLYALWGDAALYYLCYFSHPCSPYLSASTDDERDEMVLGELRANKWGKKASSGALTYPGKLYKSKEYGEAVEAVLKLKSIPDFMEVITLDRQIDAALNDELLLKPPKTPEEATKNIKAKKENQQLLAALYKQRSEAAERFSRQCSHAGLITPDEIWATL